jgi:DNA polymerase (family 10)
MVSNREILKQFGLVAQLMELHGENEFKIRTYTNAVTLLENLGSEVSAIQADALRSLPGLGKGMADKISLLLNNGSFPDLEHYCSITPAGVIEMLSVKGLGPKKVRTLWLEHQIQSPLELLEAAQKGLIATIKGFGEKTQENIRQSLLFVKAASGKKRYAETRPLIGEITRNLSEKGLAVHVTGEASRYSQIVNKLQLVAAGSSPLSIHQILDSLPFLSKDHKTSSPFTWRGHWEGLPVEILLEKPDKALQTAYLYGAAPRHLSYLTPQGKSLLTLVQQEGFDKEETVYQRAGLPFIPPELREGEKEFVWAENGQLDKLIQLSDLKGILHNHSTYSDGKHSLREMAQYCRSLGFEYLGITDHSKSAGYAGGLDEYRIQLQHQEIDALNAELAPFRIFKGIESDILADGSLDYAPQVLVSFDFIIASIHSGLNMDEEKATRRLIKAIENPYTTMLGHPTGRLLLRREGYPVNHDKIMDACAANGVIIELNANPWRLDIDWQFIDKAQQLGVMISINPDAHEMAGYHDMEYGVLAARKGGLVRQMTFNALSRPQVAEYFARKSGKSL